MIKTDKPDLVKRLRERGFFEPLCNEAAARIVALEAALKLAWVEAIEQEAERERIRNVAAWRGTLLTRYHEIDCAWLQWNGESSEPPDCGCGEGDSLVGQLQEAEAALAAMRESYDARCREIDELRRGEREDQAALGEARELLRGLQKGTAHPDDPVLKGDVPCWCVPHSMFARGPHDDECLASRAFLLGESPRLISATFPSAKEGAQSRAKGEDRMSDPPCTCISCKIGREIAIRGLLLDPDLQSGEAPKN